MLNLKMETQVFDIVKFEKEKAMARYNCFRRITKLWQILEVSVVLGLISWSSAGVPLVCRTAAGYIVEFSTYLFNHHVVFLIGNAIIILLFLLCGRNDDMNLSGVIGDLYYDYVKHSEAAAAAADQRESTDPLPPDTEPNPSAEGGGNDEEKQIVVCTEETTAAIPQCDDVAAAIEKATRQIKRYQRMHSEKLKREIGTTPLPELRRSETQNQWNTGSSGERLDAADIERLSSEEFRRTIDAFIDKHWCRKKKKQNQFDEYVKCQLLKIA